MLPEQKQQLIECLQELGYHVAMCGDGCNGAIRVAVVQVDAIAGAIAIQIQVNSSAALDCRLRRVARGADGHLAVRSGGVGGGAVHEPLRLDRLRAGRDPRGPRRALHLIRHLPLPGAHSHAPVLRDHSYEYSVYLCTHTLFLDLRVQAAYALTQFASVLLLYWVCYVALSQHCCERQSRRSSYLQLALAVPLEPDRRTVPLRGPRARHDALCHLCAAPPPPPPLPPPLSSPRRRRHAFISFLVLLVAACCVLLASRFPLHKHVCCAQSATRAPASGSLGCSRARTS